MTSYLQITKSARESGDFEKARTIHAAAAGLGKYSSRDNHPAIIKAKDAEEGQKYLIVGLYYAVTIRRINKIADFDMVASVSVVSELEPTNRSAVISGETDLIIYSAEWHVFKDEKPVGLKTTSKEKQAFKSGISVPHEKRISWSSVVDKLLFEKQASEKPDFRSIADSILNSGVLGANIDKKRLLQLIHTRYWRYKNGVIGLPAPKERE